MTKVIRWAGLTILTAVVLTAPGHAEKTLCGSCTDVYCIYCCGFFSEHSFGGAGNYDGWDGYHDDWACGNCEDGHIKCEVASVAHEAASYALKSGIGIDEIAAAHSNYVVVDRAHNVVRLRDCGGSVIAALPLPSSHEDALAD